VKALNTKKYIVLRILVGVVFIVSGLEKLFSSTENIIYVIQSYQVLHHAFLEQLAALILPWFELFLGVFLVLGLWRKQSALAVMGLSAMFAVAVGQALLRKLPLSNCGCFGELLHFPLYVTFILDLILISSGWVLYTRSQDTMPLSLDKLFED
jgi:uncharacterized membrane protein YphA (DoxX/SURF4 family)